jgi:D-arabinose 1-dehydrogenase-like Zn-dependent alcohol dehydrogenase
MALREIAIMGSAVGNTPDLVDLVALAKRGRIRLPEVERRPLSMADRSLEDLAAGRVVGRVVLEVNETA